MVASIISLSWIIIMSTTNSQHYSMHGEVALFVSLLTVTGLQAASLVLTLAMAGEIPREIKISQSVIDLINWIIYFLVNWWQRKKKSNYLPPQDLMEEAQVSDTDQRGRFYWKFIFLSCLSLLLMCSDKIAYLVYQS